MADNLKVNIKIGVDGKQAVTDAKHVEAGLAGIGDGAKAAKPSIDGLVDTLAPVGKTALGINEVAEALGRFAGMAGDLAATADQYNNMAGRLRLVAGEGAGLERALEAVRTVANASGADMDATATLYTRLSQATKDLGFSQGDVAKLTDTINKSFAVSGASAAEADGAIRQLAQGLASGALRGDEFNSVMEQSPRLSQALADGLGVGIGQLRKMAEEGKLTAEVVTRALQSQAAAIEADFGKMPDTISRATQRLSQGYLDLFAKITQGADTAEKKAKQTAEAMAAMAAALDRGSTESIRGFGEALERLAVNNGMTADQVQKTWETALNSLSGKELAEFTANASEAFDTGWKGANALARVMDISLRQSIAATGQDWTLLSTGIGAAATSAIGHIDNLAANMAELEKKGIDTGRALAGALNKAIEAADTEQAIAAVNARIKQMAAEGKLAGKALADAMADARQKTDELTPGINSVEEAYKKLGLSSQAALAKQAAGLREAYDKLVSAGAALADQNTAWAKYAEAAIAANGGVASSIIQTEAMQRGFTVAVDDSGKAVLKLSEAVDGAKSKTRELENAGRAAASAVAEAAAIAASQARTSIGTLQGSIDDFHARLGGLGDALSSNINAAQKSVFDATNGSQAAMEELRRYMQSNVGWGTSGGISEYINSVYAGAKRITEEYRNQIALAQRYTDAINSGANSTRDAFTATQLMASSMKYLGDQELTPLRDAIADANRRMLDLRAAAGDTLGAIQDEWDQLNNNLDDIEKRRADKRAAEIEAQLAAATAARDQAAIDDLSAAQSLLARINQMRIADAAAREASTATPPASSTSNHTVTITLPGGSLRTIKTASAADANSLADLLKQLQTDMTRAA